MQATDVTAYHTAYNYTLNQSDVRIVLEDENLYKVPIGLLVLLSLFYGTISILAVIGNSLVIWIVLTTKQMQTITNMFIANLALADVTIGVFAIPFQFQAALLQRWNLPEFMCPFCPFVQLISVNVSVFTLTAIAVDRHRAIINPLRARTSKNISKFVISTIWMLSFALAAPILFALRVRPVSYIALGGMNETYTNITVPFCKVVNFEHGEIQLYRYVLVLVQYFVPLFVISFVYIQMALRLWGSKTPGNAQDSRNFIQPSSVGGLLCVTRLNMDTVATMRADNASLRKIQSKLVQWELKENPLAPLSATQTDFINRLTDLANGNAVPQAGDGAGSTSSADHEEQAPSGELPASLEQFKQSACVIDSTQNFLSWYNSIDAEILEHFDDVYLEYYEQLRARTSECDQMVQEIDVSLDSLRQLTQEFNFVSEKTASLHQASESLLQDQARLSDTGEEIKKRLKYFTQAESISQRLHNPTFSVSNETFVDMLNTIDDCLEYMRTNPTFSEATAYAVKYRACLSKATQMMKAYVLGILSNATAQVLTPKGSGVPRSLEALDQPKVNDPTADAAFVLFYGKFQASSPRVKRITALIEERLDRSPDYEQLLGELHQNYLTQRATIMSAGVDQAIKDLAKKHKGDHCALVRSACAFMVHICQDEHRLFYQFFAKHSAQLSIYMEGLCTILYDTLRPYIIRIDHLETLAEICSILKVEMLDEHVSYSPDSLEAFAKIVYQLLQDVQERIGFRAQNYLESDIRNYRPSAGDLAYPEKLEMMESIALSLQESQNPHVHLRRVDSRSSIASGMSVASLEATPPSATDSVLKVRTGGSSPADMHGMWYPTVRRTLVCLSRLYRCIDKTIFQSLSQQALAHCIYSVSTAASQIAQNRTTIDGELFEIKHLLILREQIAPFRVDFTAKETSLDFSKVRTAAYELLQKRKQLFSLGSNNALLEFLLDGTPQVREQLLDSRKDVDRQLKTVCETFIKDATKQLVGPVLTFIESAQNHLRNQPGGAKPAPVAGAGGPTTPGTVATAGQSTGMALRMAPFAAPQQISSIIQECLRNIKSKLAGLQRSMQLYLANKDTEFILFRPIRNNIIGSFVKLEQILMLNAYTKDDLTIVSCPSAEQISVLLSSVNLAGGATGEQPVPSFGKPQPVRKISTSSIGSNAAEAVPPAKAPVEKKVSFDSGANTVVEIDRDEEQDTEKGKEVIVETQEAEVPVERSNQSESASAVQS